MREQTPLDGFRSRNCDAGTLARVPGSAVFLTRAKDKTPPVMAWHVRAEPRAARKRARADADAVGPGAAREDE